MESSITDRPNPGEPPKGAMDRGGDDGAPPSPAEGNQETATRKRGPHPDAGQYVVFAAAVGEEEIRVGAEGEALEFHEIAQLGFGMIWWGPAESQADAKRKALADNPELKAKTDPGGDGLWLLAPPLASGRPKQAKSDQPPPILRGL